MDRSTASAADRRGERADIAVGKEPAMIPATLHMTEADVRSLPPVVDVPTAAAVLGIGRTAAYELIRCGKWPTPVLRLGKLIRVPSAPLLELVKVSR
jgi:predicted DNA-binding transcriptional regulator AlpA